MMKKKALILLFLSLIASPMLEGQDSSGSASAKRPINDYSMIGISYGVTFSDMIFSPSKTGHSFVFSPNFCSRNCNTSPLCSSSINAALFFAL